MNPGKHLKIVNSQDVSRKLIRLRTDAAKRFKKIEDATAMIWKLLGVAEKNFRPLKGYWLLPEVYAGKRFVDIVEEKIDKQSKAA